MVNYPNEYTYQPPAPEKVRQYEDMNGRVHTHMDDFAIEKRNTKRLMEYYEGWLKRISVLKMYIMNNILGDVFVYTLNGICMEVTVNYSYPDNMGGRIYPQEGFRKKLIGKHVSTIRRMFAQMSELNFHSGEIVSLYGKLNRLECNEISALQCLRGEKERGNRPEVIEAINRNIGAIQADIANIKKEIEAERLVEFPPVTQA